MWSYTVSGVNVLSKWFSYRRKTRDRPVMGDRRVSALQDVQPDAWQTEYTRELIDLLNVLGLAPDLPEHPAYRQILDAFAELRRPLRARDLCTALDLPIAAKNTEGIRSKLKRLVSRGILVETEPGLFTQPSP